MKCESFTVACTEGGRRREFAKLGDHLVVTSFWVQVLENRPVQSQRDGDVQKVHTSPRLAMVNHIHTILEKEHYKTGGAACAACGAPQRHCLLIIPGKRHMATQSAVERQVEPPALDYSKSSFLRLLGSQTGLER